VANCSKRFTEQRLAGLYGRNLEQVATALKPELATRILEVTRRAPKDGASHWSTRKLGVYLISIAILWSQRSRLIRELGSAGANPI
jgi:hypothetical protein